MNHIAQTFTSTLSNAPKSPTRDRILSSEDVPSPTIAHCGSWKTKVFGKMKECRDVIRSIMTPVKSPNTFDVVLSKRVDSNGQSHPFVSLIAKNSMPSVPDIISSSSNARRVDDERVLIRSSTLNSGETEDLDALAKKIDDDGNQEQSSDPCLDSPTSDSLKSFLALEKQVTEEFPEENATARSIKKKISAEPFLSYAQGSMEFVWSDDTEDSFSAKPWNSLECLNSSDIGFEDPRTSSTFREHSYGAKKCSPPVRNFTVQDPDFDNNFSI